MGNLSNNRLTREQCAPLDASGLFQRHRLELIEGRLYSKCGKHRSHVNVLTASLQWLHDAFGPRFVNTAAPIDVNPDDNPSSEPEPDLIVLSRPFATFVSGNPQPHDIALLVEISDSTLTFDLTTKANLYARAGISEYWVLDVAGRRLFCHRNPVAGGYGEVTAFAEHEPVSPLAAPSTQFRPVQAFVGE